MSTLISLFIIGVSLSMDTFSISLSLGTFNIKHSKMVYFSFLVGVLHFIMPLLGSFIGIKIVNFLNINANLLFGVILLLIAIEMIIDLIKEEEKIFNLNILSLLIIAISVSLDSFSTGIGLSAITNNYLLSSTIFSMCAGLFTYSGLVLGAYSNKKLGNIACTIGIIILIIISIFHIFK